VMTVHRVAIKILNRKKIQQMDMEEKGEGRPQNMLDDRSKGQVHALCHTHPMHSCEHCMGVWDHALLMLRSTLPRSSERDQNPTAFYAPPHHPAL
jgi:hypothetical protein